MPVEIPVSATLNTGLKNKKWLPPQKGNQSGKWLFIIGKYNISTTRPCNSGAYPPFSGRKEATLL